MSRGHSFGNVEHYQAVKAIKERFNKVLTDLQKTVKQNGYAVQTVQRFRGCLENPANNDVFRLPFYSSTLLSATRHKIRCILCVISFIMQSYWEFCTGDKEARKIIAAGLSDLENYAEKGLKAFKINESTDLVRGYWLGEIK